jgi:hypothetical protein
LSSQRMPAKPPISKVFMSFPSYQASRVQAQASTAYMACQA